MREAWAIVIRRRACFVISCSSEWMCLGDSMFAASILVCYLATLLSVRYTGPVGHRLFFNLVNVDTWVGWPTLLWKVFRFGSFGFIGTTIGQSVFFLYFRQLEPFFVDPTHPVLMRNWKTIPNHRLDSFQRASRRWRGRNLEHLDRYWVDHAGWYIWTWAL